MPEKSEFSQSVEDEVGATKIQFHWDSRRFYSVSCIYFFLIYFLF